MTGSAPSGASTSFDDVLSANVRVDQVLAATKVAGGPELGGGATAAIDNLPAPGPSSDRFRVVDLGDAGALSPGGGSRGPSIGAMEMVSAAALANGARQVQVDLGARIPGLLIPTAVDFDSFGERPLASAKARRGPCGGCL